MTISRQKMHCSFRKLVLMQRNIIFFKYSSFTEEYFTHLGWSWRRMRAKPMPTSSYPNWNKRRNIILLNQMSNVRKRFEPVCPKHLILTPNPIAIFVQIRWWQKLVSCFCSKHEKIAMLTSQANVRKQSDNHYALVQLCMCVFYLKYRLKDSAGLNVKKWLNQKVWKKNKIASR